MTTPADKRYDHSGGEINHEFENVYRLLNIKAQESYDDAIEEITNNTPAQGSDTEVQFNDGGSYLGGDSTFTFNKTSDVLAVKNLTTTGARVKSYETSTTTASVSDNVEIHICNGASGYTLTLPTHSSGKTIVISNINIGTVTLSPTSGTIAGNATQVLYQYECLVLISDGTNWELGG